MNQREKKLTQKRFIVIDPRSKFIVFISVGLLGMININPMITTMFYLLVFLLLVNGNENKLALKMVSIYLGCVLIRKVIVTVEFQGILGALLLLIVAFVIQFLPVFMAFMMLFKTTTVSQFIAAFSKIHVPLGFIIAFSTMIRFIPTIKEEWESIRKAMQFRGIELSMKNVILQPVQTCEYILIPLFNSVINIIDELSAASLSRGLDCESKRTCVTEIRFRMVDLVICVICVMGLVIGGSL